MNTRKLEYVSEILAQQINHWTLFPIIMTVMGLSAPFTGMDDPNVLLWALCSLLPMCFFIFRMKTKHFLLFFLLHLTVAALVIQFPVRNVIERFLLVLTTIGYLIYSFIKRLKDNDKVTEPISPIATLTISTIALLMQDYQGQPGWTRYYASVLVGVLALFALNLYIHNYLDFLTVNASSAGTMPASDMFRSGMGLVGGYTFLGAVFLLLGSDGGWVISLQEFLHGLLITVLRGFFRLLALIIPNTEPVDQIPDPQANTIPDEFNLGLPDSGEPSLFWEILETLAVVATVCIVFIFVAKSIIALVKLIRKQFEEHYGKGSKLIQENEIDIRERCEIEKKRERKESGSFSLSINPSERIRRLYKKKVISCSMKLTGGFGGEKSALLEHLTARECACKLHAERMADIYEYARYSKEDITKETVRQMREICRGISE